MTTGRDN